MNKELILKVADEIEAMPHAKAVPNHDRWSGPGFNMDAWYLEEGCGTICCIGGHITKHWNGSLTTVAEKLGITREEADELCHPRYDIDLDAWSDITPSQAAAVLRHLAKTGKVDWSIVLED